MMCSALVAVHQLCLASYFLALSTTSECIMRCYCPAWPHTEGCVRTLSMLSVIGLLHTLIATATSTVYIFHHLR